MNLFCLLPSPATRQPCSLALGGDATLEICEMPNALNDAWRADLGRFRLTELEEAAQAAVVTRPLAPGGDPESCVGRHEEYARVVFRALRLAGFPGHRHGLRLVGEMEPAAWRTWRVSLVRRRTRQALHPAAPWDAGAVLDTLPKVIARLDALYASSGRARVKTHDRLLRCMRTVEIGMEMEDPYERLPGFVRVIEGLVAAGEGGQDLLKQRVGLIAQAASTPPVEIVGDFYKLRNKVLHMDSWRTALKGHAAEHQEQVARARYASAETLACHLLYELLASDELFDVYGSDEKIKAFWADLVRGARANPWRVLPDWDTAELLEW